MLWCYSINWTTSWLQRMHFHVGLFFCRYVLVFQDCLSYLPFHCLQHCIGNAFCFYYRVTWTSCFDFLFFSFFFFLRMVDRNAIADSTLTCSKGESSSFPVWAWPSSKCWKVGHWIDSAVVASPPVKLMTYAAPSPYTVAKIDIQP